MSTHRASQLTLWGFSALYIGAMGILVVVNAPAAEPYLIPLVLVLSAIAFVGSAVMLTGRLAKLDDSERV